MPCAKLLRQQKASQKSGVERKKLGVGHKSVYEIDPSAHFNCQRRLLEKCSQSFKKSKE